MTNERFSEKFNGFKLAPRLRKLVGETPIHVWSANKVIHLEAKLEEDFYFMTAGPLITLQRVPLAVPEHLPEMMQEQMGDTVEITSEDIRDVRAQLERSFRGDAAAVFLQGLLMNKMWSTQASQIVTQIIELQKVGNVVYLQFLHTVSHPTVERQPKSVFFVREEIIIVTDQSTSTFITVTVPVDDPAPRGAVYSQIQEWFSGLAVLLK